MLGYFIMVIFRIKPDPLVVFLFALARVLKEIFVTDFCLII